MLDSGNFSYPKELNSEVFKRYHPWIRLCDWGAPGMSHSTQVKGMDMCPISDTGTWAWRGRHEEMRHLSFALWREHSKLPQESPEGNEDAHAMSKSMLKISHLLFCLWFSPKAQMLSQQLSLEKGFSYSHSSSEAQSLHENQSLSFSSFTLTFYTHFICQSPCPLAEGAGSFLLCIAFLAPWP